MKRKNQNVRPCVDTHLQAVISARSSVRSFRFRALGSTIRRLSLVLSQRNFGKSKQQVEQAQPE